MVPRWLREPTVIAAIIGLVGTLLAVIVPVWISRRGEPSQPRQAESLVLKIVPQPNEPSQPAQAEPHELKITRQPNESSRSLQPGPHGETKPSKVTLDEILEMLERDRQRATFGAVAAILGREPQSLFIGYARSSKTAWVVSKSTGLPTGTKKDDYPPELLRNERIIDSADELYVWLRDHKTKGLDGR